MRAKILKMAGCKTEAEFYKKYPTEAAFKKKFGSEFEQLLKDYKNVRGPKKAQMGGDANGNSIPDYLEGVNQANPAAQPQQMGPQMAPGSYMGANNTMKMFGSNVEPPMAQNQFPLPKDWQMPKSEMVAPDVQSTINPEQQTQDMQNQVKQNQAITEETNKAMAESKQKAAESIKKTPKGIGPGMKLISGLVKAGKMFKAEKEQKKIAKQWEKVSDIALQASRSEDTNKLQNIHDQAVRERNAFMRPITGEELYPTYGVGTNVLTRNGGMIRMQMGGALEEGGGEIQNTYAPGDLYIDLGYEPLEDSDQMKAYRFGGPMAQMGGAVSGAASAMGSGGGGGFMGMFSKIMGMMGGGGGQGGAGGGGGVGTQGIGGGMLGGGGGGASGGGAEAGAGGIGGGSTSQMPTSLQGFSDVASSDIANAYGNNSGTAAASALTEDMDKIPVYGTIIKAVAKPVLTAIGGALANKNIKQTKRAQKNMMRNVNNMGWAASAKANLGKYRGIVEHGGSTNPQVLDRFGNMSMDDQVRWFYSDMNTLRSGGNMRENEGGGLQAVSGGGLEPMSFNPYNDGDGVTRMVRGQSHEDYNGNHTGVILDYNGNQVEAERGEPVSERRGPEGMNAVISGDQTLNELGVRLTGLGEYKGKKIKNIQADLAKKDRSINKKQTKNITELNEYVPKTSRDLLHFNALQMNEEGYDAQYKRNAAKVSDLLAFQQAMNDTARERGWDSGALSRGRIKSADPRAARNGDVIPMAQNSGILDWLDEKLNRPVSMETGTPAPGFIRKGGKWQRDPNYKEPTAKKEAPSKRSRTSDEFLMDALGVKRVPGTNKPAGKPAAKTLQPVDNTGRAIPATPQVTPERATAAATPEARQATAKASQVIQNTKTPTYSPSKQTPVQQAAADKSDDGYKSKYGLVPWEGNKFGLKGATKSSFSAKQWDEIADRLGFKGKGNAEFQKFLMDHPESRPLIEARHKKLYGKTPLDDDKLFDEKLGYGWAADDLIGLKPAADAAATTDTTTTADPNIGVTEKKDNNLATILGQALSWFRPQPGEPLAGEQLTGEMFAMANAHPEAVQARFKQSLLDVPYDISYQDKLNENQASFRALQKAAGSNPEALAALAAQKYQADSGVLGEQFRANQAMKQDVYSRNRAALNADQERNLEIADQQYVRQQEAISNTKRDIFDAMSSVSDKYLQNKLENRTLQTYQNMFPDFSYDRDYRINKTGAPVDFNTDTGYRPDPDKPLTHVPVFDKNGKYKGIQEVDIDEQGNPIYPEAANKQKQTTKEKEEAKKGRNGALTRAFRNM